MLPRRALIIGIDHYQLPGNDLQAATADAAAMASSLAKMKTALLITTAASYLTPWRMVSLLVEQLFVKHAGICFLTSEVMSCSISLDMVC